MTPFVGTDLTAILSATITGSTVAGSAVSDAAFKAVFDMAPEAISLARLGDGVIIEVNAEWQALTGFSRAEVLGRTALDIGFWPDAQSRESVVAAIRHNARISDAEVSLRMRDGALRSVRMTASVVQMGDEPLILTYFRDVTARLRAQEAVRAGERALEESNEKLNRQVKLYHLTESVASVGYWALYPDEQVVHLSAGYALLTGFGDRRTAPLADHLRGLLPEDRAAFDAAMQAMDGRTIEYRWRHPSGSVMWLRSRMYRHIEQGVVRANMGVVQEVSAEKAALQATRDQLSFIQRITSRAPGMLFEFQTWEDTRLEFHFASAGAFELLGVTPDALRADVNHLFRRVEREDVPRLIQAARAAQDAGTHWQSEFLTRPLDGVSRWLLINAAPDVQPDGSVLWCGAITDISARKRAEAEIERLAFFDALTGLPNRRMLMDRLKQAMDFNARHITHGALLFIDLDNFKILNDTLGHHMGDKLLQQVSERLRKCVRSVDTVARLGGDEFVVMLEDIGEVPAEAAALAESVGRKVLTALNQEYELGGQRHHSSPSIGITLMFQHLHTLDELLKRADLAMYQAKAAGRNTLRFFDPEMQAAANARAVMEKDLRLALQNNAFVLYYQPVVDDQSRVTGVEALVRWQHPLRGLISPAEFIPVAEQSGLILDLGQWVLQVACAQLVTWSAQPVTADLTMAVNVSARQFRHPDFCSQILDILRSSGANPHRLKLELTESLLLSDIEDAVRKMGELRAIGVGFSLDDFGTGYSSLSYLKRLPLDQLKIDQSFVRDVLIDPNDAAIARTILNLAQSLDLGVVAEGVETEGQRQFLLENGCKSFQGYLFGRPVPLEQLVLDR